MPQGCPPAHAFRPLSGRSIHAGSAVLIRLPAPCPPGRPREAALESGAQDRAGPYGSALCPARPRTRPPSLLPGHTELLELRFALSAGAGQQQPRTSQAQVPAAPALSAAAGRARGGHGTGGAACGRGLEPVSPTPSPTTVFPPWAPHSAPPPPSLVLPPQDAPAQPPPVPLGCLWHRHLPRATWGGRRGGSTTHSRRLWSIGQPEALLRAAAALNFPGHRVPLGTVG